MADLNKVYLIGRLTRDPELRYTTSQTPVMDLPLATGRSWRDRNTGEEKGETLYIDVTVWRNNAENCAKFLHKGSQIHVEGYLKKETWDDRNSGEKRSKIKVEGERIQFLDSRSDSRPSYNDSGNDDYAGGTPHHNDDAAANGRDESSYDRSTPAGNVRRGLGPTTQRPSHLDNSASGDDIPF